MQDVELVAHVEPGLIHVRAPGEFQDHVGLTSARNRMDLAQVLDHADCFFDGLGNEVFHFQRRGTFVFRAHGQRRIAQVWQQVDLESVKRDHAE